jgi:hypothetical protein
MKITSKKINKIAQELEAGMKVYTCQFVLFKLCPPCGHFSNLEIERPGWQDHLGDQKPRGYARLQKLSFQCLDVLSTQMD